MCRGLHKPGLLNITFFTSAGVVGDVTQWTVDGGEVGPAHIQEVWPHTTHRHFGDVCEWLADGTTEKKHAHLQDSKTVHVSTYVYVSIVSVVRLKNKDKNKAMWVIFIWGLPDSREAQHLTQS